MEGQEIESLELFEELESKILRDRGFFDSRFGGSGFPWNDFSWNDSSWNGPNKLEQ